MHYLKKYYSLLIQVLFITNKSNVTYKKQSLLKKLLFITYKSSVT